MKILMYKWKSYNHIDVEGNLIIRGHEIDILDYVLENVEEDSIFEAKLNGMLDAINYDIVFSINYFPIISDICEIHGLPYIYWTCDSQITCMYHESIFNSCNTGFLFDYTDYITFEEMGANVHYLPLAAPIERIEKLLQASDDLSNFSSDISFIGSMYNKNMYDKTREHLPEYLRGYFDCALNIQQDMYLKNVIPKILTSNVLFELQKYISKNPSKRSLSSEAQVFSTAVLGFKAAQLERKSRLTSLSKKYSIDVYTDDENVDLGFCRNKGVANYWQDSPKIFNQSKINLNFTIKNIISGIPLRIFDIMASRGFLITNFQAELPMYFKDGEDIIWFTTPEELEEKIEYYISNDRERNKIITNAYEKIKEQHTYQHRFDEMAKAVPNI